MPTMTLEPGSPEAQRRPGPWISPVRVGSVLLAVGIIGMGTISVVTQFATREHTETLTVDEAIALLSVDVHAGDVQIRDAPAGSPVQVEVTTRSAFRQANWTHEVSGYQLELSGSCSGAWPIDSCSTSYEITVPADVRAEVQTGSGDAQVTGLTGATKVRTGSGDIRLNSVTGGLEARTGSGDIQAHLVGAQQADLRTGSGDLTAGFTVATTAVNARTGSGDIRATFAVAPQKVTAKTGSGNLRISVPPDRTAYDVTGSTGSGDRQISVPTGSSQNRIEASTGSGDVSITSD